MLFASFTASLASTTIGGGGSLLLLSVATALPINVAIPLHAAVSFFGNFSRWVLLLRFVDHKIVILFGAGSIIGVLAAAPLVNQVPEWAWQILLGTFLLVSTWWRPRGHNATSDAYPVACGLIASFLSVFVGATKPFVAALLGQRFEDYKVVISTTNACATLPHLWKIILFTSMGVTLFDYWSLIVGLVCASLVGVFVGRHILIKDNGNRLRMALKILCTVLGGNLLLGGLGLYPWS